jgi:hypothetical protein
MRMRRQMMRTTLNLDEDALKAALAVAPGLTKTQVINEALREYVLRQGAALETLKGALAHPGRKPVSVAAMNATIRRQGRRRALPRR